MISIISISVVMVPLIIRLRGKVQSASWKVLQKIIYSFVFAGLIMLLGYFDILPFDPTKSFMYLVFLMSGLATVISFILISLARVNKG